MLGDRKIRILQSAASGICAILVWRYTAQLEGTEFSGGNITGKLVGAANISILLFVGGLMLTFFGPRLSVVATVSASLLALPLFLYATCPGPFRYIFKGNYSVPAPRSFVFDSASCIGIAAIALALLISCFNLFARQARAKA